MNARNGTPVDGGQRVGTRQCRKLGAPGHRFQLLHLVLARVPLLTDLFDRGVVGIE